jgi:hypothetical protein
LVMMLVHMATGFNKTWESCFRETYCLHLQGNFSCRSMFLPNVGKCPLDYTMTHPKRQESS